MSVSTIEPIALERPARAAAAAAAGFIGIAGFEIALALGAPWAAPRGAEFTPTCRQRCGSPAP